VVGKDRYKNNHIKRKMAECDAIKFKVRVYEEDSVLWTFAEKSGMTRRENTT
jgi:hypothetical protein